MTDPNFVKSVAPNFAAAVRAAVNSHPRLRRVIQFNSLKFPTHAGLGQSLDGFAAYRPARGCDVSARLLTEGSDAIKYDKELLSDIAAIGIGRLSDPWVLFEEFAKRFSVFETNGKQSGLRDIQSIAKAGGGDRDELRFVLHDLFRLNGISSEWVEV